MTFYSAEAQAVLKRHPVILATSRGLILPRTDYNLGSLEPGDGLTETEFVDLLLGMHPIRSLNMYSWDFDCISSKNLMWLDGMGVFSELEHWYIGWNGHLTVRGMFGLLSIMPNLKGLHVGNVSGGHDAEETDRAAPGPHDDAENGGRESSNNDEDAEPGSNKNADNARNTDDPSPKDLTSDSAEGSSSSSDAKSTSSSGLNHWNPISDLATPACALTHLVVSDDWGIDFMEYDALLSQSHNSLTHVEGHWIYESEPGDQLAIALKKCSRVQSLTIIGCSFDNEKLIQACPRLRRLEVENMRGEFRSAWEFLLKAEAEELPMSPRGHLQTPESSEIEDVTGETNEGSISSPSLTYTFSPSKLSALLPALLSELVLLDCRPSTGPEFIARSWTDSIAHVLPLRPKLQTVRVVTRKSWQKEVQDRGLENGKQYWKMRSALRMARVKLSMSDKHVLY